MNIFKRIRNIENIVTMLLRDRQRNQDTKFAVFLYEDHDCIIDRIDFSGDDHGHYALIVFLEDHTYRTVPAWKIHYAGWHIARSEFFGESNIPSKRDL